VKKLTLVYALAILLSLATASAAYAQDRGGEETVAFLGVSASVITTSSVATTASLLPVGIVITIVLAVTRDDRAHLEDYMRENAVALQHDLYMGGGDAARDLAVLFGVDEENMDEFAHILHEHRARLVTLVSQSEIDDAAVYEFADIVITEMEIRGWRRAT
jgi:hypothetical protein